MIIIFGWQKEPTYYKPILDTHCYNCNRATTWHLCKETEWLTFFDVPTVPFIHHFYLICDQCRDVIGMHRKVGKKVERLKRLSAKESERLHDRLVHDLEFHQLLNKTPWQRQYVKSMRSKQK